MNCEIKKSDTVLTKIKLMMLAFALATPILLGLSAYSLFNSPDENYWNTQRDTFFNISVLLFLTFFSLATNGIFLNFIFGKIVFKYTENKLVIEELFFFLVLKRKIIKPEEVTRILFYVKASDPLAGGLKNSGGKTGQSIPSYDIAIVADKKSQLIFSSDMEAPSRKVFDTLSEWFGWERRDSVSRTQQNTNHQ